MMRNKVYIFLLAVLMIAILLSGCQKKDAEQLQTPVISSDAEGLTVEDFEQIELGMYIWDVVELLGYPGDNVGSGTVVHEYITNDGIKVCITYIPCNEYDGCVKVGNIHIYDDQGDS